MASVKAEFEQFTSVASNKAIMLKKSSVRRQYFATFAMNLLVFSYGASCGWTSAAFQVLEDDSSPLASGPISSTDASWIASGICIGGLVGNFVIGWV